MISAVWKKQACSSSIAVIQRECGYDRNVRIAGRRVMYYGEIKRCDVANGIGVRVTLFVSGCTNHCENCFQPQTWDFHFGQPFTKETENQILDLMQPKYISGLTLLGGEPFEPQNQRELVPFLKRVRELYPQKTIWAFSGFRYEDELLKKGAYPNCEVTEEMLSLIDVLVDGRFVEALKDISLRFRGSSNQRILDLSETRKNGYLILWDENKAIN